MISPGLPIVRQLEIVLDLNHALEIITHLSEKSKLKRARLEIAISKDEHKNLSVIHGPEPPKIQWIHFNYSTNEPTKFCMCAPNISPTNVSELKPEQPLLNIWKWSLDQHQLSLANSYLPLTNKQNQLSDSRYKTLM